MTLALLVNGVSPPDPSQAIAADDRGFQYGDGLFETTLLIDGRVRFLEAMTASTVFALRGPRLEELAQRSPALALELIRAAGGVMAVRMRNTLNNPAKGSATT